MSGLGLERIGKPSPAYTGPCRWACQLDLVIGSNLGYLQNTMNVETVIVPSKNLDKPQVCGTMAYDSETQILVYDLSP